MTIRKLVRLIFLFLAAGICTIAFHLPNVHHPGKTTNLYPIHSRGKYGYVNQAGKWVIPPQFDFAKEFVDGMGAVQVNQKWGAIDLQGKTIFPIQYDFLGLFSEGIAPVLVNGKWGFVNANGEMTIPAKYDDVGEYYGVRHEKVFSEGLASVKQDGKWGFIDRNGKQVTPCFFDQVTPFSGGIARVKNEDSFGMIDPKGEWVILRFSHDTEIPLFSSEYFQGILGDSYSLPGTIIYYDKQGKVIGSYFSPPKLAREFQEGLAIVEDPDLSQKRMGRDYPIPASSRYYMWGTKCGFQDNTGRVVIDLKFDRCRLFKEGVAAVKVKDKWGYIDKTGQFVAPPQFDYADDFFEGRALVVLNKKYGFIDRLGKIIVSPKFDIDDTSLRRNFELSDLEFDPNSLLNSHRFYNGFAKIIKGNQCGYLDRHGKIVIPPQFSSCSPFDRYGIAKVERGIRLYEEAYINRQGKILTANLDRDRERLIVSVLGCILWIAAISLHEFCHAIVAYWGGDRSVKEKGYLSFNPIKYFNPITSLILPGFAFAAGGFVLPGAAVYIDEDRIRNRCWKSVMAAAGPIGSALFGLLLVPVFHLSIAEKAPFWVSGFLAFFISLQFLMMLFNLVPIPPLDGYRIFYPWFPAKWQNETLLALSSLLGLIIFCIVPLFVPATSMMFFPLFEGVYKITESLGISIDWVLKGFELFDRDYTALTLLVASLVYFSNKPEFVFQAAGLLLEFMAAFLGKDEFQIGRWNVDQSTINKLALAAYEKSLELEPKNAWAWRRKGENLQRLNRHEEALVAFEKSLELEPKNAWAWRRKGKNLQNLNRHEEALAAFDKSLELNPKYAWAWRQKGWNLQQLNRHEEALAAFDKSLELNPKYAWAWGGKGWSLQQLNRHEEALVAFDKSLELDPKDALVLDYKGRSLQQLKRHEEALTAFDKLIELDPKDAWAWRNKGFCLGKLNRHEEALTAFEKLLEFDPKDGWAWVEKGWNLDQLKCHEEAKNAFNTALEAFEKLLDLNPKDSWAWGQKGWSLQQLNRHEEALTAFEKSLELDPKDSWAWGKKGWSLQQLKRHEEALAAFEKSLELDPKDAWAWGKKVWNLQQLNRHEEALTAFEKSLELDPVKWDQKIKELLFSHHHNFEEGLEFIEAVLKLHPQSYFAWKKKGTYLGQLNRDEAALAAYEKAIEINPNYEHIWDTWERKGWCLERLKRYEEALEAYEKRLELYSDDDRCWRDKRNCLQKMNRVEEALAAYEKGYENAVKLGWLTNAGDIKEEIGKYLQQLNRDEEALTAFEQAIKLYSDYGFVSANKLKGDVLEQLNRHDEARMAYEQAIQGYYKQGFWYHNYFINNVFEGDREAIVCCEKVLQSTPENASAWSLRAMALQELGCDEAAIHSFDLALENQIDRQHQAYIWYYKGVSFDRLKRYPEALDSYHQAIETAIELELPSYTLQNFWFNLGLTLLHLNRHEDALEAYLQSQGMSLSSMKRRDGSLIEIYKQS